MSRLTRWSGNNTEALKNSVGFGMSFAKHASMNARLPLATPGAQPQESPALSVSRLDGLGAIDRYAAEIDRFNCASERPNLFLSSAFLSRYALRTEHFVPGSGEFLLVVRCGEKVIGLAPLRRSRMPILPKQVGRFALTTARIEFLAPLDTEQPHFLCASADEDAVAAAIMNYLCQREGGWGMLEFGGQRPGSAIHRAIHAVAASNRRFRARDIEVEPVCELALPWADSKSYFRSLPRHMRSNISRQARRLYATGEVELVIARGPEATSAWFDCYCDVEARSWKSHTSASIARHPRRLAFYREIARGLAGFEPSFVGVLLGGALIGGLILGANQTTCPDRHGLWALEMAYDHTHAALGPGQLLLMLGITEGIDRRSAFLNLMQSFAYYKHRWGAAAIELVNVQLIPRLSLPAARAGARDVQRWWRDRKQRATQAEGSPSDGAQASAMPNRERSDAHAQAEAAEADPIDVERARSLTQSALARSGDGLRRLDRNLARSYLPFALE